ncbi:MAG: zinc ribbon domain-containing protein, partial [Johnsonella sp.]|nr:zinc ribbon domain-containing protein [Johnsonella sp.]
MKRCKSCGSELADHVKFCTECGEKYDSTEDFATSQPYEDITKHEDITKYNDITRHEEVQLEREMARSMENIETDIFPPHRKEPLEEASGSSSSYQGGEIPPAGNIFPEQTFASAAKEEASAAQGFEQRAWRQDMNTGERGANEEATAYHYGYGAGSPKKRGNKTTFVIIIGIIALLCLGGVVYAGLQILNSSRHMITESKDKNKDRKKDKDKKDKGDKKD